MNKEQAPSRLDQVRRAADEAVELTGLKQQFVDDRMVFALLMQGAFSA